jgi:hypothetical protein
MENKQDKNENMTMIDLVFMSLQPLKNNNDSLDHYTYTKVVHRNSWIYSFFIGRLRVSLLLHLIPLSLLGQSCIIYGCVRHSQNLYS